MSKNEHLLLLTIMARQQRVIDRIVDVLKNRLLTEPERKEWDRLLEAPIVVPFDPGFRSLLQKQYLSLATDLGIKVGVSKPRTTTGRPRIAKAQVSTTKTIGGHKAH
jgi:hypothetical protein